MNTEKINILVVDDHPMTTDAYINLIKLNTDNENFNFLKATDCQSAYRIIENEEKLNNAISIALIDISIPGYPEEKLFSGTDIGMLIRDAFAESKIIMLTMHTEPLILNKVLTSVGPEGFISKSDIDFETFPDIFNQIMAGENYFSPTISSSLQSFVKKMIGWDEFDTEILLLLEKGILTKDLPDYIELSLSTIEKRKTNIKRQILGQKGSDKQLIEKCRAMKMI
ncbi:MAG: response regulator [Flavobacterium sp.]